MHGTGALLAHLGFDVEQFSFVQTVESIPGEIRRMGAILGRADKAEAVAGQFETELKSAQDAVCGRSPTAIAYDQNGVALGGGTLADSVMRAAGLENVAAELGYTGMAPFPLEALVKAHPDIVILRHPVADAPALADQIERHPALRALSDSRIGAFVPAGAWACGGPFVIDAVHALERLRQELSPCRPGGNGG